VRHLESVRPKWDELMVEWRPARGRWRLRRPSRASPPAGPTRCRRRSRSTRGSRP